MGVKTKEMGGGAATGLSNDWIHSLQSLLNGGGLGTAGSPMTGGNSGNIMSVLQDILSGGQGKAGSAISQLLSTQQTRDVNGLRSRFGVGGGTAFGTPGAYAESNYRAQAAPQITQAITGMQLQAMGPLFAALTGLSDKGITQRQLVQEKSGLAQGIGMVSQLAGAAAPFLAPGIGGMNAAQSMASNGFGVSAPATLSMSSAPMQLRGGGDLASLQGYFQ